MTSQTLYRAPQPYPKPEGLSRNIRYARVLQYSYSGGESELTAIHQYIYHHIMTEQDLPEVAGVFKGIAVAEMHHLSLLGECILQLSLHPTFNFYQGTRRARWNSGYVRYGRNPRDMIDLSISGEQNAIEGYYNAIRRISDEQVQALLKRIIEDEELHIQALTELRSKL